ncbi:MAG: TraB/GumN family protein [Steroidobacteraceae bacterium]
MRVDRTLLATGLLFITQAALAGDTTPQPLDELTEVVVTGRYPGPPLWKVSKGDHVLWILPLVDVYPKKMQWESARVEKLIAGSQEYIYRPGTANGFHVSNPLLLFSGLRLYRAAVYLPGKKTLADVLPPDLYSRFRALKSRYFRVNTSMDRKNIDVAAEVMKNAILDHENLEMLYGGRFSPKLITDRTSEVLKNNKTIRQTGASTGKSVKITSGSLKALRKLVNEAMASPAFQRQQVACFERIVAYFEKDLEPVKKRANAWARGHVDDLVNPTPLYSVTSSCLDPFFDAKDLTAMKKLQKDYPELGGLLTQDRNEMMKASRQLWLTVAEAAIARNASTFAMLNVNDVLDKDGLVDQLRAKGYTVEISAEPAAGN